MVFRRVSIGRKYILTPRPVGGNRRRPVLRGTPGRVVCPSRPDYLFWYCTYRFSVSELPVSRPRQRWVCVRTAHKCSHGLSCGSFSLAPRYTSGVWIGRESSDGRTIRGTCPTPYISVQSVEGPTDVVTGTLYRPHDCPHTGSRIPYLSVFGDVDFVWSVRESPSGEVPTLTLEVKTVYVRVRDVTTFRFLRRWSSCCPCNILSVLTNHDLSTTYSVSPGFPLRHRTCSPLTRSQG